MTASAEARGATARPWGRASAWLLFLGPFFFATYGFATWLTAQRAGVGSVVFGWEHAIPFWPWTIVPYWMIDVIYAVSLFVCVDRAELDVHAKRLLTAQVVAIASFLLFPLKFSYERAETGGVMGDLFALLGAFDRPFNQAPSLHIALLVILWALFARKLTGVARAICDGSFVLIGVSVLTTWQHHFIDVPTGALLGFFCLWLWPQGQPAPFAAARRASDRRRSALAARYAAGALLAAAIAAIAGGIAWWLLWVTVALLLVAVTYAFVGVAGFQKRDGRLSPAAGVLLAPYVAGARINAWAWTSRPFAVRSRRRRSVARTHADTRGARARRFHGDRGHDVRAAARLRRARVRQSAGARPHAAGPGNAARRGGGHRTVARHGSRARLLCARRHEKRDRGRPAGSSRRGVPATPKAHSGASAGRAPRSCWAMRIAPGSPRWRNRPLLLSERRRDRAGGRPLGGTSSRHAPLQSLQSKSCPFSGGFMRQSQRLMFAMLLFSARRDARAGGRRSACGGPQGARQGVPGDRGQHQRAERRPDGDADGAGSDRDVAQRRRSRAVTTRSRATTTGWSAAISGSSTST
jgi:hypothetical protein